MAILRGTDVSVWQGSIDFAKMSTLARFCWIRGVYGAQFDTRFKANWANSKGKLPRGAYLYYLPDVSGLAQANALIAALDSDWGELPVAIDIEQDAVAPWTLDMVASLKACINAIGTATGRTPLIYSSAGYWNPHLGSATFGCDLWVAHWTTAAQPLLPSAWTTYKFWQTNSSGNGFAYGANSQFIDEDIANFTESEWAAYIAPGGASMGKIHVTDGVIVADFNEPITITTVPAPAPPLPPPGQWTADFWAGDTIPASAMPIFSTTFPATFDQDWGNGSPNALIPNDHFVGRFTKTQVTGAGDVEWTFIVDDGVRFYVDGALILDAWKIQAPTTYKCHATLTAASHNFKIEYWENTGGARLAISSGPYVAPVPPPPTPPPVPAVTKAGLGVHALTSVKGLQLAQAAGCQVFMAMNRPDEACGLATGDPTKWFPGCGYPLVMYRIYHDTNAWSAADMISQLAGLTENANPNKKNVIITLCNEWDNGIVGAGNSAAGMTNFINWTLDCVSRLHVKGLDNVAIFSASVGTPEFNDTGVCDAIKAKLAPLWNTGAIRWLDYHSYSPNMQHIYNTTGDEIWYEKRWAQFYTRCGFDPTAPGKIISSEGGLDEGGTGGYPAHQMDRTAVLAHMTRTLQVQQAPLVVNGISYPSPFLAVAIFQGDPDDAKWAGYRCTSYYPLQWQL